MLDCFGYGLFAVVFARIAEFEVLVYSLSEILVEKIRSIMQRGYSRDYYDVWRLLKGTRFRDSEVKKLLKRKCGWNGIRYEPSLLFDEKRLGEMRAFWEKGLLYLTKELQKQKVLQLLTSRQNR
jgi:predicted nucleotidyltransferase component of viral defense system